MAEKPPEEGYISVVDEEPEILELLKWDHTPQVQKPAEQPVPKTKTAEKRSSSRVMEADPLEMLEANFIEKYRLTKELVYSLCEELKPVLPDSTKSNELSIESKFLAALTFYTTGKYPKSIGGKTDPTVHYVIQAAIVQITEGMNHPTIVKKYIHFPHLREERDVIKARYYIKYGVPHVLGCVDCTHVPIPVPEDDQKTHFNKSYHSKKVQIICDSDLTILSVDPSPGSLSHDAILTRHAVRVDLESLNNSQEQCFLLGGPYYSLKPYIMTPIPKIAKKSPASPEKYFNNIHSQTHGCITETIRHLKCRWKCLQATCNKQIDPAMASMVVVACCILHNICNQRGLPVQQMAPAEERLEAMKQKVANGPISKKLNDDEQGNRVRADLVQRLWSEKRLDPENSRPKKRAPRKDKPVVEIQQNTIQSVPMSVPVSLGLVPNVHQDDPSKRPRIAMNPPPTYSILQPAWGHYPPHH